LFENYGEVSSVKVFDGFAFIDFARETDARDAIKQLDGYKLCGMRFEFLSCQHSLSGKARFCTKTNSKFDILRAHISPFIEVEDVGTFG
jgi:RNA recognition motif-containing protein